MNQEELDTAPEPSPFVEGDDYDTLSALKAACRKWAIKKTFEFKTTRSNKSRYEIECKTEGCPWRLYAKTIGGPSNMFRIRKHNANHTCIGITHEGHQQATCKFICDWILPKVRIQPRYRPTHIKQDAKNELGITISYSKALRAKEMALELIHGTHEDAYKAMPKYCADIESTNPNSIVSLDITSEN